MSYNNVVSNMGGDRLYQLFNGDVELVNKNNTKYTGRIEKKTITCQDVQGNNFRSYVYRTTDDRWFDRAGLPIKKPENLVTKNDEDQLEDDQ